MNEATDIPHCVEPGWHRGETITNPGGPPYRLLWWTGDRVGFEHLCDRDARGTITCAPLLQEGHAVTSTADGTTVNPSVLCADCGTHGFIKSGQWAAV